MYSGKMKNCGSLIIMNHFLKERRQLLADEINNWLGGITDMESPELAISIEELIYEGRVVI